MRTFLTVALAVLTQLSGSHCQRKQSLSDFRRSNYYNLLNQITPSEEAGSNYAPLKRRRSNYFDKSSPLEKQSNYLKSHTPLEKQSNYFESDTPSQNYFDYDFESYDSPYIERSFDEFVTLDDYDTTPKRRSNLHYAPLEKIYEDYDDVTPLERSSNEFFENEITPLETLKDNFEAFIEKLKNGKRRRKKKQKYFEDFEDEFSSPEDRIFGGWYVDLHELPWIAKLKIIFPPDSNNMRLIRSCGAALINDMWLLTARHCVVWHERFKSHEEFEDFVYPEKVKVFLGSHGNYGEDGFEAPVELILGHPEYGHHKCNGRSMSDFQCTLNNMFGRGKDYKYTNDIAMIKLRFPPPMNRGKIWPVALPWENNDYKGAVAVIGGWGVEDNVHKRSFYLKAAELRVIDSSEAVTCRDQRSMGKMCARSVTSESKRRRRRKNNRRGGLFSRRFGNPLSFLQRRSDNERSRGGSVCPGDSGGPLVLWDETNKDWTLIGVLSNGSKDCRDGYPAVFTRVGDFIPWIYETMKKYTPRSHFENNRRRKRRRNNNRNNNNNNRP